MEEKIKVPVSQKYTLTLKEAAAYFTIGEKKLRNLAQKNQGVFAVMCGNRHLIIREKFEEFLAGTDSV